MIAIQLPLTQEQAIACAVAANSFGVEPWEIAVDALALRRRIKVEQTLREAR